MHVLCPQVLWKGIDGDRQGFQKDVRERVRKLINIKFSSGGGRGYASGAYHLRHKALLPLQTEADELAAPAAASD